jgi:hypothetical protein
LKLGGRKTRNRDHSKCSKKYANSRLRAIPMELTVVDPGAQTVVHHVVLNHI